MTPKNPTPGRKPHRPTADKTAPKARVEASDAAPPSPGGKIGRLVELLRRPGGATIPDLMGASGWQAHSIRGAIAGAVKKKLGLAVLSAKGEAGRIYRIEAGDDAARG